MKDPLIRFTLLAIMASLLTGCTVGPRYRQPAVPVPTVYHGPKDNPQDQAQAQAASFANLPWWQIFQDSVLQDLIRRALKQNYDLLTATEKITQARAQLMVTRSNQYPQLNLNGTAVDERTYQGFPFTTRFGTYAADATFQLDLFGQLRRATESARAQLLATEYARRTEILTLVSDVASDYFALLSLDLQLQITLDTIKTQEDAVKLTNDRLDHGVATKLDVLQAKQVLDTANAQVPELQRQIGLEEDALSILLGDYPHGVTRGLPLVKQQLPPEVPAGLPSSLLARRPDISQAEQNLISANAQIGVAKAAFFPQISLTGSGGGAVGRSTVFSSVISSNIGTWSGGANLTQVIFDGGKLRGDLRSAKSQERQSLIAYKQSIQGAFKDVSDALIAYQKYYEVRVAQQNTVQDLSDSVSTSLKRYRGGIATYLEVLDNQRSLFSAQLTLAQDRGNEFQSLVQLYKALGGGWRQ
ncbi:MAG: efflux system, outer rane lipoprotein NodT [Acidobacteriaceae bacterium]|nr:efflux system, outer rane lipoprotein NodT [Acidobacteriaceae bacterium]